MNKSKVKDDGSIRSEEMNLEATTKNERSLLLYFESVAVDYGGLCQGVRMNKDDFTIAKRWNESKFIKFGRIYSKHTISAGAEAGGQYPRTHWVVLSEEAWKLAHEERRERSKRLESNLTVERIGIEIKEVVL